MTAAELPPGPEALRCAALRRDGAACQAPPLFTGPDGFRYCWAHRPGADQARREARRRGGAATSRPRRARRAAGEPLAGTLTLLEAALADVLGGELDPKRATAAAAVAGALCRVYDSAELDSRLRGLENQLGGLEWPDQ